MKKLYNVIFPIWFILIMPPIVLLVLPSNFIIDSIVLILAFRFLKISEWFNKYKNTILKVWGIGFLADIVGSLLLLITQFINGNDYLYKNLIYPLAWNPFNSVLAFFYVLIVVLISGLLIYIINYKFSFNKIELEKKQKKIISLLLAIITAPYLFFLPTSYFYNSKYDSLNKYQDTYLKDSSKIEKIISNLYSSSYYSDFTLDNKDSGITINYKDNDYGENYKYLEEDALLIFKLVKDVSYVEFKINNKIYSFDTEYINNIFDIKKITINDIYQRYNNDYFKKFVYLGHIDEYDFFDTSTTCSREKSEIYSDLDYNYFVECSSVDFLYLVNNNSKIKLKTALKSSKINIADLFKTNLEISRQKK